MGELTAKLDLPLLDRTAATAARKAIRPVLESWNCTDDQWRQVVELIVTELVTNAVDHGGGAVELALAMHDRSLTISVADGSAVIPEVREADDDGGRGLRIIDALSDAWGVEDHHGGKRVWVRLREPDDDAV